MLNMFSKVSFFGLLAISAACAQSSQPIQASIPFAFMVRNTTLPAGNYQLNYGSSAQRLTILALDGNSASVIASAFPAVASESSTEPGKLVFHCYGRACYLAQVWQGSVGGNRGLQVLETERCRALSIAARMVAIAIPTK